MVALITQQAKLDAEQPDQIEPAVYKDYRGLEITAGTLYEKIYCNTVISVLSEPGKSVSHFAVAIGVTVQTVRNWVKRHPDFRAAVMQGLEMGKAAFLDKINDHAWMEAKFVNNGLIKLLAKNLYDIDLDTNSNTIVIVNSSGSNLSDGESGRLYRDALEKADNTADIDDDSNTVEIFAEN